MNNTMKLAIKQEKATNRESMIYEILGKFGDRLQNDISEELRTMAETERLEIERNKTAIWKQVR